MSVWWWWASGGPSSALVFVFVFVFVFVLVFAGCDVCMVVVGLWWAFLCLSQHFSTLCCTADPQDSPNYWSYSQKSIEEREREARSKEEGGGGSGSPLVELRSGGETSVGGTPCQLACGCPTDLGGSSSKETSVGAVLKRPRWEAHLANLPTQTSRGGSPVRPSTSSPAGAKASSRLQPCWPGGSPIAWHWSGQHPMANMEAVVVYE